MNHKTLTKPFVIVTTLLFFVSILGVYLWHEYNRPKIFELYVFNLSQGRAVFVRTAHDKRILIDGGASSEVIRSLTQILPFYSKRIDTIVVTNESDRDIGGLIDVVGRYHIGNVILPKITLASIGYSSSTDNIYASLVSEINTHGVSINHLGEGDHVNLGQDTDVDVLFPADPKDFLYSKTSAPELIFDIKNNTNHFIIAGNVTEKIQKYVANKMINMRTSKEDGDMVLIVSNSANGNNIADIFANATKPNYIVYSKNITKNSRTEVSKNKDPFYFVLEKDRFNTKEKGTIHIVSLDGRIVVETI